MAIKVFEQSAQSAHEVKVELVSSRTYMAIRGLFGLSTNDCEFVGKGENEERRVYIPLEVSERGSALVRLRTHVTGMADTNEEAANEQASKT